MTDQSPPPLTEAQPASEGNPASTGIAEPSRIHITDPALEAIREMLTDAELSEEGGLRLTAGTGAGCSVPLQYGMTLEAAPKKDDRILEGRGVRIFMDPESAWVLDGLVVDYVTDSPMGEGFAFRHPRGSSGRAC